MLWIAFCLLLVAYLPGALILRAPFADRARRAALPADERVFWGVVLSAAWSSMVALALAAAERYSLERLLVVNAVTSLAILGVWRRRLGFSGSATRAGWTVAIPLVLVAVAWLRFFPSSEYVTGGRDPGVYVNEGIAIAERGSLLIHDPVVASVPPASRDLFFPSYNDPTYYSIRFMGFFILDPDVGTVVGQFPHLYPVWIAIAYGVDGLAGARQVVGWWSILGLLAVYFAGMRLVGRPAAAIAAALLASSLVEVWFARYPNSEMVMQALLFAALLAFARAHIDGDRFFAPAAGVLLGLLIFLRIDAMVAVAAAGLASVFLLTQRQQLRWSFIAALGLMLTAGWAYLACVMRPYAARPLGFVANLQPLHLAFVGGASVALTALLVTARRPVVSAAIRTWVPRVLAVLVVCAAGYAYFLRAPGGRLAPHDAAAFRTFAWYLPPAALAGAVVGFALVVWHRFWRDPALLLTVTAFGFFFFYKIQIVPEHFWMARRFVPVILPAALLMAAALVGFWPPPPESIPSSSRRAARVRWLWQSVLAALFLGFVGWRLVDASRPIMSHVEYQGAIARLDGLAKRFGDNDLVLVEPRWSSDMHVLALPLAYVYGRNILVLSSPRPDKARLREFLEWAHTRYREVYFMGGGGADLLSRSIGAQAVAGDRFQLPEYESRVNGYPRGVRFKEFDFGVYRLVPAGAGSGFRSLDVGAMDDLFVWRFHAKQRMDSVAYRWSKDASYVALPGLSSEVRTVTIWMSAGGRPGGLPPAHVSVYVDDHLVGDATIDQGFHPYLFQIPPGVALPIGMRDEPAVLKLVSNTWNPAAALGVTDNRDLGVMVSRVEVQ